MWKNILLIAYFSKYNQTSLDSPAIALPPSFLYLPRVNHGIMEQSGLEKISRNHLQQPSVTSMAYSSGNPA